MLSPCLVKSIFYGNCTGKLRVKEMRPPVRVAAIDLGPIRLGAVKRVSARASTCWSRSLFRLWNLVFVDDGWLFQPLLQYRHELFRNLAGIKGCADVDRDRIDIDVELDDAGDVE